MSKLTTRDALEAIWRSFDLPESMLSLLSLTGNPDEAINSSFRLGVAAQASVALSGLSAAYLHSLRTGAEQVVSVDARHAILAFHSEAWYTVDGQAPSGGLYDSISGLYRTKDDDGFVRIHTNFPHHRRGILSTLNLPDSLSLSKEAVAQAMLQWNSVEFETEAASKGMCATALRSFMEWDRHPHARALSGTSPVAIHKIGEAPKRAVKGHPTRPLDGIRVLDLCRVLAGPIAGRALAAHGADTLLITSPHLPSLPNLDVETSLGKRTAQLDLTAASDRITLANLISNCDVFLQSYRPGGLEEKGFGVKDLAALVPGIVCANLTAWGWDGPWKNRRGFDSLVQTATGFNHEEAMAYQDYLSSRSKNNNSTPLTPKPFPVQALDHAAAYFLAFGINVALARTINEGGSWEVRVSLAAVGQWLRSLGRLSPNEAFGDHTGTLPSRDDAEISELSVTWPTVHGRSKITALRHPAVLSQTPVREGESGMAPMVLNAHRASWLDFTYSRDTKSQQKLPAPSSHPVLDPDPLSTLGPRPSRK
ncbi:hypothetical protein AX17_005233 [Amanita inopinata Kibby_2008]|nr:hypothetical protein AX17_005233 [Amanita inopinata Kibby_2008]